MYQFTKFRLASRSIWEPQLCYSDAYAGILYNFVSMMQIHSFAFRC